MNDLISIIIPVFNRAELIPETLNSIIFQTYKNWECIVVDDGSTDNTLALLEEYSKNDKRIKYYSRPAGKKKGANVCRNLGFERSTGEYIIWFDSDDLMTPNHLEAKLRCIEENKVDFVVARTQNFQNGKLLQPYNYIKKEYGITASDFILLKIHWYTYDVMLRRKIAERIRWNEEMSSWQDYNYFCKMLIISVHGEYLDNILTHRRLHEQSIQSNLKRNAFNFSVELLNNRIRTYHDIAGKIDSYTKNELVNGLMNLVFELAAMKKIRSIDTDKVYGIVLKQRGKMAYLLFKVASLTNFVFNKGYVILEAAKKR